MKSQEEARLSALRMIKAALMKQKVDSPKPLDEAAEMQVLKTLIKQRIDAAEMFRKAGRVGAGGERRGREARLSKATCRPAPAKQEIDAAIAEALAETGATSLKQMGMVMKAAQARLQGKTVDGKALSDKVRSRLTMTPPESEKKFRSYVPDKTDHARVHLPRGSAGPGDDRRPGRRQCLPGTARRHDHRRHLSRRRSSAWRCCG